MSEESWISVGDRLPETQSYIQANVKLILLKNQVSYNLLIHKELYGCRLYSG